jgi:hypothetical protein
MEGQSYRLFLPIPRDDEDVGGFRAIDRATLTEPREYLFRAAAPTGQAQIEPAIDFCADVLPIFMAKCSDSDCHGAPQRGTPPTAAASLVLTTREGVERTARNRVAQGANTSGRSYSPEPPGKIFGVNMAIIAPHDPGSSWLTYKIEPHDPLVPHPDPDAGTPPDVVCTPPPGAPKIVAKQTETYQPLTRFQPAPDDVERAILSGYVPGREMPYPHPERYYSLENPYAFTPLTFQERERVRIWIAHGAALRDCGECKLVEPSQQAGDGGVADAGDQ